MGVEFCPGGFVLVGEELFEGLVSDALANNTDGGKSRFGHAWGERLR